MTYTEEMRQADAEIEASFVLSKEEREAQSLFDREARWDKLDDGKKAKAASQHKYYQANKEAIAERNRQYRLEHKKAKGAEAVEG